MAEDLTKLPKPTVKLVGEDGNAFSILGRVAREMRSMGWNQAQIDQFIDEATGGDYTHLLGVVMKYVEEGSDPVDENDEYDESSDFDDFEDDIGRKDSAEIDHDDPINQR